MAHIQAFSLFLCLASCLANTVAASDSLGFASLEERAPSDSIYHVRSETEYDVFPTDGSLTTLEARGLLESGEHLYDVDALIQRGLASHSSDIRQAIQAGLNSLSSGGARSGQVSALQNHNLGATIPRPQGLNNPLSTRPKTTHHYASKPKNNNNSGGRMAVHELATDLYKRSAAKGSSSLSPQRGSTRVPSTSMHHRPSTGHTQPQSHGHTLMGSQQGHHRPPWRSNIHTMKERIANFPVSDAYKRDLAGNAEFTADEFLVKRSGGSGTPGLPKLTGRDPFQLRRLPGQMSSRLRGHFGSLTTSNEFRSNFALQGSDAWKRDLLSDTEMNAEDSLIKRAGKSLPASIRPAYGRPRSPSKELRMNAALPGSDVFRRDAIDNDEPDLLVRASNNPVKSPRPSRPSKPANTPKKHNKPSTKVIVGSGPSALHESSELYKRYLASDSDFQARSLYDAEPDLFPRAQTHPSQSQRQPQTHPQISHQRPSHNQQHKPQHRPSRPTGLFGSSSSAAGAQGSVESFTQVNELYKRDIDETESDYLSLLLAYLDLQSSDPDSVDNESETHESKTDLEYESMTDLAMAIQSVANRIDYPLNKRAAPVRQAASKPSGNIGSLFKDLSSWLSKQPKPQTKPKTKPGHGFSNVNASKGGSGSTAHQPVSGDDPY